MSQRMNLSMNRQGAGCHPHPAKGGNKRQRYVGPNVISRRYFILFALLALVLGLAACGSGSETPPTPAEPTSAAPSTMLEESAAADTDTRIITDAAGREVEIPIAPQRIVTLTEIDLDSALALDVIPVGSVNGRGQESLPSYLVERAAGVVSVGSIAEPNLETILSLNPDLILVASPIPPIEALLPDLEQIAPVAVTSAAGSHWMDAFLGVADVLNRADEAEAFLEAYRARAGALGASLPAGVEEVSVVRWNPDGPVVMLPNSFSSLVLADIGLGRPAAHAEMAGSHPVHSDVISLEQIEVIDADVIFAGGLNPDGDAALRGMLEDPLVQVLSAVQAGRLVLVDGLVWGSIGGPLAAWQILDDVEQGLGIAAAEPVSFPITIEHKFGSVTIPAAPERVVSIGYNDQDILLALGIVPVAVRYWYGDAPNAIFPWSQDAAAGAAPVVLEMPFGELNYEAILALEPDLIVGVYSGMTQAEYDQLSLIAPTIAQTAEYIDFGMPWQEMTQLIGDAVGRSAAATALVAEVEAKFEAVRAENPAFAGQSIVVAYANGDGTYGYYTAEDGRGRFFTNLGFEIPAELVEIAGDSFYATISQERLDLLDRDLIIFLGLQFVDGGRAAIENDPLINQLDAMQEGRVVYVPLEIDDALQFGSVLSLEYALEGLLPELQAVVSANETIAAADSAAFPVTIEHKFGSVTIPAAPERVITIGFSEQDPVLALGVIPVAVRDWFGDQPYGVWPWAQDELGAATPELLQMPFGELNYELLASLDPDLLVATHSGITQEEYDLLSQIAPTLAQPAAYPDFGVPWQVQTQLIGRALGKEALANELIAGVEAQIMAANEAYAGFGGASVAWVTPAADAGQFWVVGENTPPLRFLTGLGLTYDPALSEVVGDLDSAQISSERLDLLDVDVLIVRAATLEEQAAIEANPLFSQLEVVRAGRVIFFVGADPVYGALSFSTVLSLPYAITELTPQLAMALE